MRKKIKSACAALAKWDWLPVICFVVLPALVVRGHWTVVAADATAFREDYYAGDTRAWWKAACIVGIALWMLCMSAFRFGSGQLRGEKRFLGAAGLAAAGVLAATWFSPFPFTKWIGYTAFYEGAFVLLAYLVALWHCGGVEETGKRLWILRSALIVLGVNILLGLTTGLGYNFWQSEWGAWVIGAAPSSIRYNFAGLNMASGTVYQSNHYGMLMAMLASLALGMAGAEKGRGWKCVWGGGYVLAVAALLFSHSRSGMAVLGGVTLVFLVLRFRAVRGQLLRQWKKIALAGGVLFVLAAAFLFTGLGATAKPLLPQSSALFFPLPLDSEIRDIGLKDNVITVKARGGTVHIGKLSAASWYVASESGQRSILAFADQGGGQGGWRSAGIPVIGATLSVNQGGNVLLRGADANMEFFVVGVEIFAVDQTAYNLRLRTEVPLSRYELSGYEGLFSARGYIWARSLEKFRERPWFGWGPGSLALVFPNGELLNKERFSFGADEDKGHSILVTLLVQTGIIGTILYLLPFGYAVYVLARSRSVLRAPLLLAMAAYAVCGLTNDSTPGVTPLFCVFAGLAVAEAKG